MLRYPIILSFFASLCLVGVSGNAQAQYLLPVGFENTDSLSLSRDLESFAGQISVHFGNAPGVVFQRNRAYPRIQLYYQQDAAFTFPNRRYWSPEKSPVTSTGVFTGIGDVTANLQVFLRYNAMVIDNKTAVFNGFGARYRMGLGTDSLHALSLGFLTQKLAGSQILTVNDFDLTLQYAHYFLHWITRLDFTLSYVSGTMDVTRYLNLGSDFSGEFKKQVGHVGMGLIRTWNQFSAGVSLQTTGRIWNALIEVGWRLPSSF